MVDLTRRCLIILVIFITYAQNESIGKSQTIHQNKQFEELNDKRSVKDTSNVYSSSKANEFLSYDKCIQRMKCPVNRKEECSEECQAGNTEEEVEEHSELTIGEHRHAIRKAPKRKYDINPNPKKHSNKNKHLSGKKQQSNHTMIKTDL